MDKLIPGTAQLSTREQLVLLRDLFNRTGALHEVQALQLRSWPFCVAPLLTKAEGVLDIEGKVLTYEWSAPESAKNPPAKKPLLKLQSWVRTLLGTEWKLCVKYNGALIYETGADPEPNVKQPKKRRAKPKSRKPARKR